MYSVESSRNIDEVDPDGLFWDDIFAPVVRNNVVTKSEGALVDTEKFVELAREAFPDQAYSNSK